MAIVNRLARSGPEVVLRAFRAPADENRLSIIEALRDGECCVCELQASLD